MKSIRGTFSPRRTTARLRAVALLAAGGLAVAGLATATSGSANAAPTATPTLKLFTRKGELTAYGQGKKHHAYLYLPMLVEAMGGDFDVRAQRAFQSGIVPGDDGSFSGALTVNRVVGGTSEPIPGAEVAPYWNGLHNFFHVTVTNANGKKLYDADQDFCPSAYDSQRMDPDSSDTNQFPSYGCYGSDFTHSQRWGVSQGWAVPVQDEEGVLFTSPVGKTVTVTVSVNSTYQALMDGTDSVSAPVKVVKAQDEGDYRAQARRAQLAGLRATGLRASRPQSRRANAGPMVRPNAVRTMAAPDSSMLPDLQALPSNGISVSRVKHGKTYQEYLNFGATIWVGGASRMDIEGFRDQDEHPDLMTAYQYFYNGDQVVGKQPVGTLEFDNRKGHHHWHLEQFAEYQLINADTADPSQGDPVVSGKQSFCLAPTDAVDLADDNADLQTSPEDLGSECGADTAMWIRETLPVGWGDTYTQQKGGQAFNITALPHHTTTYWIRLIANPNAVSNGQGADNSMYEQHYDNNVSLRKVIIGWNAKTKRHTVCVPAVDGLDQEGFCPN